MRQKAALDTPDFKHLSLMALIHSIILLPGGSPGVHINDLGEAKNQSEHQQEAETMRS